MILQRGVETRKKAAGTFFSAGYKKEPLLKHILRYKYLHLMLLPALIWLILFKYVPIYGISMSFQDYSFYKGFFGSPFVGFKHFIWLFENPSFRQAFINTWLINLGKLALGFPCPIILALLLNEIRHSIYKRSIQTITYLPHFISWVIMAGIFNSLFAFETGAVSRLLGEIGLGHVDLMQDARYFRGFVIVSHVWKEVGWGSIIYLAAIASINPELYEASFVDGAGRWKQALYITIPGISSTMIIVFIISLGNVLTWGFDQVYNLYNPLVFETGDIMQTYIIRSLQENPNFSRLAAVGFIRSTCGMTLILIANGIARRFFSTSLY